MNKECYRRLVRFKSRRDDENDKTSCLAGASLKD